MPRRPHIHPCHIAHQTLKHILHYDKIAGTFHIYSPRCCFNTRRTHMQIDKHLYPLDRLAMYYITGEYRTDYAPVHIDGDKNNNAYTNLRPHDFTTTAIYKEELQRAAAERAIHEEHHNTLTAIDVCTKELRKKARRYKRELSQLRADLRRHKTTLKNLNKRITLKAVQDSSDDSFH